MENKYLSQKNNIIINNMQEKVKIAIDAMGGEKSPTKVINGIKISLQSNKKTQKMV